MEVPVKGNILEGVVAARYILATLCAVGAAIVSGATTSLSLALLGMMDYATIVRLSFLTNNFVSGEEGGHEPTESNEIEIAGPFKWTWDVVGIILSAYFCGYFITQICAVRVSEWFPPKWMMFFGVTINVLCTLLTPALTNAHYLGLVATRLLQGVGAAVTMPAINELFAKWIPEKEHRKAALLLSTVRALGVSIFMFTCGLLTANSDWTTSFYVLGSVCTVWCALWAYWAQDSPQRQPFITAEERSMIAGSLPPADDILDREELTVPWRAVCTSPAFLVVFVVHVCRDWGWHVLLLVTPVYLGMLQYSITQITLVMSLPPPASLLFDVVLAKVLDWMCNKNAITELVARKIGILIATATPALCLVAAARGWGAPCAAALALAGADVCRSHLRDLDSIAPTYAGALKRTTHAAATLTGIAVPVFTGGIMHALPIAASMRPVLYVTSTLYAAACLAYLMFASSARQPWDSVVARGRRRCSTPVADEPESAV